MTNSSATTELDLAHLELNRILNTTFPQISLSNSELNQLAPLLKKFHRVPKGTTLVNLGDKLHTFYLVKSGAFKAHFVSEKGHELISGFYYANRILGLDAFANNSHASSITAIADSIVYEMPLTTWQQVSTDIPKLHQGFLQVLSQEIINEQRLFSLLTSNCAQTRMAGFLYELLPSAEQIGDNKYQLNLMMSRQDISQYIGLTIESVSRSLSALHRAGIIHVNGKMIDIEDANKLKEARQKAAS